MYRNTTKPLISNVIQGFNATVFAYGATGEYMLKRITKTELVQFLLFWRSWEDAHDARFKR